MQDPGASPPIAGSADASTALAERGPRELPLQPMEGMARWLGPVLFRWAFRFISMIEVPRRAMSGPVIAARDWFRRDRHRHPHIDPDTYRLEVTGVARPRTFSLEDLEALPWEERLMVMECAGNGNHLMGSAGLVAQGRWQGPSLQTVLDACGGVGPASHLVFRGLDPIPLVRKGYHYGLAVDEVHEARALLAIRLNGEPLPRARGFPVRLIVPGIYSMSHVKWLGRIEGRTEPHDGVYNRLVFTNKQRRGGRWERVEARWIGLKSMITRCVREGDHWRLTGWAWGGGQPITRVEVTTDGGETWREAALQTPEAYFAHDPVAPADRSHAWTLFDYHWQPPRSGTYVVASRAHASDGSVQRMHEPEHVKGHFDQTRVKWRRVQVP